MTSSKMRRMPRFAVASRTAARKSGASGTMPKLAPVGSRMTAAMSSSPVSAARIEAVSPGGSRMVCAAISAMTPAVAEPSKCEAWPAVM